MKDKGAYPALEMYQLIESALEKEPGTGTLDSLYSTLKELSLKDGEDCLNKGCYFIL